MDETEILKRVQDLSKYLAENPCLECAAAVAPSPWLMSYKDPSGYEHYHAVQAMSYRMNETYQAPPTDETGPPSPPIITPTDARTRQPESLKKPVEDYPPPSKKK